MNNIGLSVCIIAKNEEKNIRTCIEKINKFIVPFLEKVEILVIDTGSTDLTVQICKELKARVCHFEWINDFSAARNYGIEMAKNDRILFLDADEFIEDADIKDAINLADRYPDAIGRIERRNLCRSGENSTCIMTDRVERLFNRNYYHYEGCIHEQVTRNDDGIMAGYPIPVQVYHEGYMGTKEQLKNKAIRNNQLLFRELEKNPDDPYIYYQLGQSYSLIDDKENEYESYQKGYMLNPDRKAEYTGIMITRLGLLKLEFEDKDQVLKYIGEELKYYTDYADFLCFAGYAYMTFGLFENALNLYKRATKSSLCHLEGNDSFRAYHNMACIYEGMGDELRALEYYKKAGTYDESVKKLENLLKKEDEFYRKKISVILDINCENESEDKLRKLLDCLEKQSIGIGHMDIIIPVCNMNKAFKEIIHDYEKKHEQSVVVLESDFVMNRLQGIQTGLLYATSNRIIVINTSQLPLFDSFRVLNACMDKTNVDVVSCNIHYGDMVDFILEIENNEKRNAVKSINIFGNNQHLCLYNSNFLFNSGASVEEIIKGECEEKYAGKVFCIRDSYIM